MFHEEVVVVGSAPVENSVQLHKAHALYVLYEEVVVAGLVLD